MDLWPNTDHQILGYKELCCSFYHMCFTNNRTAQSLRSVDIKGFQNNLLYYSISSDLCIILFDFLVLWFQLTKAVTEELIFLDFLEGQLDFPPTFKYDVGTDEYDTRYFRASYFEHQLLMHANCEIFIIFSFFFHELKLR